MESSASARLTNRRRHRRVPANTFADVQWEDASGRMNFARARVLDVSDGGVLLSVPGTGFRAGAPVRVRIEQGIDSDSVGVPQQAAQEFIDAYFAGFPGVRAFIDRTLADARAMVKAAKQAGVPTFVWYNYRRRRY